MKYGSSNDNGFFYGTRRGRTAARATLLVLGLALTLQCLTPPGYMAGSVDAGWPVVLCPDGLPVGFVPNPHQGHRGHHLAQNHDAVDAAGHDQPLDGHCPLGGVLDGSSVSVAQDQAQSDHDQGYFGRSDYREPIVPAGYSRHLSRGPPRPADWTLNV